MISDVPAGQGLQRLRTRAGLRTRHVAHLSHAKPTLDDPPASLPEVRRIPIASIRTDGETQHRLVHHPNVVREYAELMRAGTPFPPIEVRWDGTDHWISDGFQRIDAAKLAGQSDIRAAIRPGTRSEAQWDSYSANGTHGLRRTAAETEKVLWLALQHPKATKLSNIQIAGHLHLPESTVRYWRKKLSSQSCEDDVRVVTRGKSTYELNVKNIGRNTDHHHTKSCRSLRDDLATMKGNSSSETRPLLLIIEHWVLGHCEPARCLDALERFVQRNPARSVKPCIRPPASDVRDLPVGTEAN